MRELKGKRLKTKLTVFHGLRKFTRTEAAALHAAASILKNPQPWKPWVEEAFGELFGDSRGLRITLLRESTLSREPAETCTFAHNTVSIGRSSDNDIVLPPGAVSRRHARITLRDRELFLEDLQSASGTYVGGKRLEPEQPRRMSHGDEFLIFPYTFKVFLEELWEPDPELAVLHSQPTVVMAGAFHSLLGPDLCVFDLSVHPRAGSASLALPRSFLQVALSRLTRGAMTELAADDADLLHFIVLTILERANRELRFPFQCSLAPRTKSKAAVELEDEAGMMLEVALKLTGAQGRLLLFLPHSMLRLARNAAPAPRLHALRATLQWKLTIRLGFVRLTVHDLQNIGPGDALLYTPGPELLLPARSARPQTEQGWSVARDSEQAHRFVVGGFFERSEGMQEIENAGIEENTGALDSVDVQALPVRVHVVLSELELSLAQLEALKPGSIVELDGSPASVQLVVNGKLLGSGELVEVEEKLAVQINRWGQA